MLYIHVYIPDSVDSAKADCLHPADGIPAEVRTGAGHKEFPIKLWLLIKKMEIDDSGYCAVPPGMRRVAS